MFNSIFKRLVMTINTSTNVNQNTFIKSRFIPKVRDGRIFPSCVGEPSSVLGVQREPLQKADYV
jgi:hypothetical protein